MADESDLPFQARELVVSIEHRLFAFYLPSIAGILGFVTEVGRAAS